MPLEPACIPPLHKSHDDDQLWGKGTQNHATHLSVQPTMLPCVCVVAEALTWTNISRPGPPYYSHWVQGRILLSAAADAQYRRGRKHKWSKDIGGRGVILIQCRRLVGKARRSMKKVWGCPKTPEPSEASRWIGRRSKKKRLIAGLWKGTHTSLPKPQMAEEFL